jgi:voltage-gated potassium channel
VSNKHKKQRLRKIKAGWRDTWLLLREFALPVSILIITILGGGLIYFFLARFAGEPLPTPLEAVYQVFTMTFLQTGGSFPEAWYLGLFYFVMPLVGLILLAHGVTEFGVMLFNRGHAQRNGRSLWLQPIITTSFWSAWVTWVSV